MLGADFRISGPNATSGESNPAAAENGTVGEYLVVWEDSRNSATRGVDVYGRRVGADGRPIGGDFRISGPNAISSDLEPAPAWNGAANQYPVVWGDRRNESTRGPGSYGRRVAG